MEPVQPIREREDIEAIKQVLKHKSLRNYCLFVLGINSGLRISDLLSLTVRDVADECGIVRDRVRLRERKTGKMKDFPLCENAKLAITEYLAVYPYLRPTSILFRSRTRQNGPITASYAATILKEAAKEAGVEMHIATHTLRKTFGYQAYKSGVDITRIQKLLNHSTPYNTLAYIGITQEELDNIYLNLDL
ncbi:site-specific integrase [Alicyclobacillus ferrooxydans]|uniref:Integrase n=1 Tax=Alicyclobacillus ferrooxydans TaxID=471514 RepID=A0A0P9D394_9BACL|nr:site-specific integrase [Alicyclobacillus ferrooxydans]KPV43979.1 integrase [Alicyclobacillus ferrooxydans]